LTGDALRLVSPVNLEKLLPYGHLFHELEFRSEDRTVADAQAISNLLAKCSNLRKLNSDGSDVEQDSLVIAAVWQSCPLLEELELWRFSFNQQEQIAGAGTFTLINRSCKHLRILKFSHCELSTSILRSIAGMDALKELTLYAANKLVHVVAFPPFRKTRRVGASTTFVTSEVAQK
jgi:hypothetical protein